MVGTQGLKRHCSVRALGQLSSPSAPSAVSASYPEASRVLDFPGISSLDLPILCDGCCGRGRGSPDNALWALSSDEVLGPYGFWNQR